MSKCLELLKAEQMLMGWNNDLLTGWNNDLLTPHHHFVGGKFSNHSCVRLQFSLFLYVFILEFDKHLQPFMKFHRVPAKYDINSSP